MVPLDRALVSSHRLSIVTMSLTAAVWPQFAMQVFRLTCIGSYVNMQVTTFTFRAQATTCSKHHTRTVMDAGCECAPWVRSANPSNSWALVAFSDDLSCYGKSCLLCAVHVNHFTHFYHACESRSTILLLHLRVAALGALNSSGSPVHWTAWTPGFYATGYFSVSVPRLSCRSNVRSLTRAIPVWSFRNVPDINRGRQHVVSPRKIFGQMCFRNGQICNPLVFYVLYILNDNDTAMI